MCMCVDQVNNYTLCLRKKVLTFKLSVTLSNLNRLSKFVHCWKAHEICYKNPHVSTHITLGMLLHYRGKLKIQMFCRCGTKRTQIAFLIASNFVIHPQISIFAMFKIASLSPYWLQIKLSMLVFFYLFTFAINLWHRKFVAADVTAVFVSNQHGIQQRGQDFDKKFVFEGVHSKEVDRRISREKLNKEWC